MISKLDFVAVPSTDLERSRIFDVDPGGNRLISRHRYAPNSDGSTP